MRATEVRRRNTCSSLKERAVRQGSVGFSCLWDRSCYEASVGTMALHQGPALWPQGWLSVCLLNPRVSGLLGKRFATELHSKAVKFSVPHLRCVLQEWVANTVGRCRGFNTQRMVSRRVGHGVTTENVVRASEAQTQ
jgi:hypothetical protein